MSLSNTYWLGCDPDDQYITTECTDVEYGKVRSAALIKKSYLQTILADPQNPVVWENGIGQQQIIIMPYVSGSFDPGEPKELKGYGRRLATRGPRDMVLTFSDANYLLNYIFYSRIQTLINYVPAFRTGSILHIGHSAADIFAKNVVEEDIESIVSWEVRARWRNFELPHAIQVEGLEPVFNFDSTASQRVVLNFASGKSFQVPLTRVAIFRVGDVGAPMVEGDVIYTNAALANKKVLILASGLGITIDDGLGTYSIDPLERRVNKQYSWNHADFIGGVFNKELIEIYTYEI